MSTLSQNVSATSPKDWTFESDEVQAARFTWLSLWTAVLQLILLSNSANESTFKGAAGMKHTLRKLLQPTAPAVGLFSATQQQHLWPDA